MATIIQAAADRPLVLHSKVRGPIESLSFLEKSLLFAELSMIAYGDEDEALYAARQIGFIDACLFDNDGSQAYRFRNHNDCVIACRGTEPHQWNDIRADVNAAAVFAETVGRVHRGFKREVDDLWPMLEEVLLRNRRPVWFCGHSLGGAMATICAGRCYRSHIPSNPSGLFTYGCPRVGDKAYVNFIRLDHYRWVNNNDVVTRVPPTWAGYRHAGEEQYFNHRGELLPLKGWRRRRDRLRGIVTGLLRWRLDLLDDHSIHTYVSLIAALVAENQRGSGVDRAAGEQARRCA